jgi:hypothetical protein
VRVNILDANDNAPVFSQAIYNFSVSEAIQPNTDFATVKASDADSGSFGTVTFAVVSTFPDLPAERGRFFLVNDQPNIAKLRVLVRFWP